MSLTITMEPQTDAIDDYLAQPASSTRAATKTATRGLAPTGGDIKRFRSMQAKSGIKSDTKFLTRLMNVYREQESKAAEEPGYEMLKDGRAKITVQSHSVRLYTDSHLRRCRAVTTDVRLNQCPWAVKHCDITNDIFCDWHKSKPPKTFFAVEDSDGNDDDDETEDGGEYGEQACE